MRGYVVDKNGKPVQFRVKDPESEQVSIGIMIVRGSGVVLVDAGAAVNLEPGLAQHMPVPGPRVGAMAGEMDAPVERGVVVADQAMPTPGPAVGSPSQAMAAAVADEEGRPAALASGPAKEL